MGDKPHRRAAGELDRGAQRAVGLHQRLIERPERAGAAKARQGKALDRAAQGQRARTVADRQTKARHARQRRQRRQTAGTPAPARRQSARQRLGGKAAPVPQTSPRNAGTRPVQRQRRGIGMRAAQPACRQRAMPPRPVPPARRSAPTSRAARARPRPAATWQRETLAGPASFPPPRAARPGRFPRRRCRETPPAPRRRWPAARNRRARWHESARAIRVPDPRIPPESPPSIAPRSPPRRSRAARPRGSGHAPCGPRGARRCARAPRCGRAVARPAPPSRETGRRIPRRGRFRAAVRGRGAGGGGAQRLQQRARRRARPAPRPGSATPRRSPPAPRRRAAAVVLDQVQIRRRNPGQPRQIGLPQPPRVRSVRMRVPDSADLGMWRALRCPAVRPRAPPSAQARPRSAGAADGRGGGTKGTFQAPGRDV